MTGNPFGNTFGATVKETTQGEIYQDGAHYTGSLNSKWTPTSGLVLDATFGIGAAP